MPCPAGADAPAPESSDCTGFKVSGITGLKELTKCHYEETNETHLEHRTFYKQPGWTLKKGNVMKIRKTVYGLLQAKSD